MSELLAGLPDCDASDRVRSGTDLKELEPPSKRKKTGECSLENEEGLDDSRSNVDGWPAQPDLRPPSAPPIPTPSDLASSPWMYTLLESLSSVKSSSENKGGLDDSRSKEDGWTTEHPFFTPPLSPRSVLDWIQLESNGSLDREDNKVSSENEGRLLDSGSYDDQLSKLNNTLPVSSTEIDRESNEINGIEGSCEVRSVAGKYSVRRPNAVQLLSASSRNSDCLDNISWMDDRYPSPLLLLMRDRVLKPLHLPHAGTIFGNLKHDDVLMTDQLFSTQLSYIKKNNMDLSSAESTPEAEDLSSHLLKKNRELRPEAGEVLLHPFFWNSKEKLRFLWRINDRLLLKDPAPDPDLLQELESNEPPVFNGNWIDKIDPKFKANILQRGDYYDYNSVVVLLRFLRNKYVHFLELPRKIKKLVGWNDESFYNYFAARFPSLLMKSYGAASRFCREEKWFKEFHGSEISSGVLGK